MSQLENLDLLQDVHTLVCDKLQVVSYKWLSRNYSLSSNAAKRLLQEYVDNNEDGFDVVYALAGHPKNDPSTYCIKLVSTNNLQESKLELQGECSIHIYSVQACLPKDPATLWNAEIIQSEELYKQPANVDNSLRDNRFGGILNSSVERNVEGTPVNISSHRSRGLAIPGSSNSNISNKITTASHSQQNKVPDPRAESSLKPTKSEENVKITTNFVRTLEQTSEPAIDKDTAPCLTTNGKKGQNDSVGTVNGKSLANMWGRASKKPKPMSPSEETAVPLPPSASADAQISAAEWTEDRSSDDEQEHVNVKRASRDGGRKRRVVLDSSEDEDGTEDAINLASPDVPKERSCLDRKKIDGTSLTKETKMDVDFDKDGKPAFQKDKATFGEIPEGRCNSSLKNVKNNVPINDKEKKEKSVNPVPTPAPERKKVLKTHMDEWGREVTEVVWEGEDEKKKTDKSSSVKKNESIADSSVTRPIAINKKSPAVAAPSNAPSGKAGSKKAGNSKDPKQGNIMSFFKRV